MKTESIVFTVAGMCFGIILGWVIGTQQGPPVGFEVGQIEVRKAP